MPPVAPSGAEPFSDLLVGIPTYNEAENAPRLVVELRRRLPGATIMVIDDASPDGTGDLVALASESDPHVRVHRRPAKLGLGTAYLAAFAAARQEGASIVLTMDADFSHRPEDAPRVVQAARAGGVELAIGSRYVAGGHIIGWPASRSLLSATANWLVRAALHTQVRDCTGSFRAYRMSLVERIERTGVQRTGYSALPEMLYLATSTGARVREVPITFVERTRGATKLTQRELVDSMASLAALSWRRYRNGSHR